MPIDPATTLQPHAMQLALRRRLRLPLHLSSRRCGPSPGCGALVDAFGDHTLACPRTGLLARKAKILERAWVRVAREAVGADGQVVPQQWLAHTTAPNVDPADRRRLDLVIYGATPLGGVFPCDWAQGSGAVGTRERCASCAICRVRAQRAPPTLRTAARAAWSRRWWSQLAASVQQAVAATALGNTWLVPACASQEHGPELDQVLNLAESSGPCRSPLR